MARNAMLAHHTSALSFDFDELYSRVSISRVLRQYPPLGTPRSSTVPEVMLEHGISREILENWQERYETDIETDARRGILCAEVARFVSV
jgi:hypothetical protein